MNERIICLRGEYLPESEARVSVFDRGMPWGDGVYDVVRTIRHQPLLLREGLDRLCRSLRMARIQPGPAKDEMEAGTLRVLERNLGVVKKAGGRTGSRLHAWTAPGNSRKDAR